MKPLLVLILLLSFSIAAFGQTRKYAGTYSYGDTIPSGNLEIYPESDSTLLFNIFIINSQYHTGNNTGRIIIRHDSAIYSQKNKLTDCKLLFQFKHKEVIVTTIDEHDNCGYGYGVYSDGVYRLRNNKTPEYYFTGDGDSLYFRDFNKHQADTIPMKSQKKKSYMDDIKGLNNNPH